jgi:hypothetical protein
MQGLQEDQPCAEWLAARPLPTRDPYETLGCHLLQNHSHTAHHPPAQAHSSCLAGRGCAAGLEKPRIYMLPFLRKASGECTSKLVIELTAAGEEIVQSFPKIPSMARGCQLWGLFQAISKKSSNRPACLAISIRIMQTSHLSVGMRIIQ